MPLGVGKRADGVTNKRYSSILDGFAPLIGNASCDNSLCHRALGDDGSREYGKQACHDRRLLVELADAVEDGSPLLSVSAVYQMAHNALLVNHDSQRESLPLYP